MSDMYDRFGKPIESNEWSRLRQIRDYKIVKQETLPNGVWVSTVWLGLDHQYEDGGVPLIFETMVFPKDGTHEEVDMERYSTEEEAINGHLAIVKKWRSK